MIPPRAYFFIGLNAVRVLSIISLILVFASTIFVMVTNIKAVNAFMAHSDSIADHVDCDYIEGSTVPNQPAGVFWAVVASLLIIFQTVVLFLSEISWPSAFFDRYFPVLGKDFGLGALGIFQCLISTQILSHHVDDFTLVAAFLLFAVGCLNMLLGLIFREKAKHKRSVTSWREEAKGILPTATDARPTFVGASPAYVARQFSGRSADEKERPDTAEFNSWRAGEKAGYGFGRQGEKAAGLRGFILQRPEESLPRYMTPPPQSSVKRNVTVASSSSSFASPFRASRQSVDPPAAASGRGSEHEHEHEHESASRSQTPVRFKSSPTAI